MCPLNLEKKISLRLDQKRYALLEEFASQEGFTVSLVVRHLVYRFLEDQRRFGGVIDD